MAEPGRKSAKPSAIEILAMWDVCKDAAPWLDVPGLFLAVRHNFDYRISNRDIALAWMKSSFDESTS